MKRKNITLIGAIIVPLLVGCSSAPIVLNSVGPPPFGNASYCGRGFLRVFTAVDTCVMGENTYYYPHTGYSIYTESGKLWKYIPNHTANVDETPAWVTIPAGKYLVKADANFDVWGTVAYPVTVPVVIQEDQTTELHLDANWKAPANASTNELVYLPSGKAVGWRASSADSVN